jgi:hypothetical protein
MAPTSTNRTKQVSGQILCFLLKIFITNLGLGPANCRVTDISAVTAFAISSFAVATTISIAILIIGCLKSRATRIDRGVFFTFSFIVEARPADCIKLMDQFPQMLAHSDSRTGIISTSTATSISSLRYNFTLAKTQGLLKSICWSRESWKLHE